MSESWCTEGSSESASLNFQTSHCVQSTYVTMGVCVFVYVGHEAKASNAQKGSLIPSRKILGRIDMFLPPASRLMDIHPTTTTTTLQPHNSSSKQKVVMVSAKQIP